MKELSQREVDFLKIMQLVMMALEYEARPKINNGTRDTHPCQISIDEKTNSKTT